MVVDVQDYAVLLCRDVHQSAGQKMVEAANERDLPVQIDAYGVSEFDMQFPQYQVVLLGPQVKYMLKTLSDKSGFPEHSRSAHRYDGLTVCSGGDNVLNYALSLIPAAH
ncbi:PTS system cellobiose-specific transporter subunit IIB [Klebsiella pneumoniae]|nr:PTS system cellobiose-specific transporter subunit IIB [Klebsiella pneumoniae]